MVRLILVEGDLGDGQTGGDLDHVALLPANHSVFIQLDRRAPLPLLSQVRPGGGDGLLLNVGLQEGDVAGLGVDLHLHAVDGPSEVLQAAPQLLVHVDPDEVLPDGCHLLDVPLQFNETAVPEQLLPLEQIGLVVFGPSVFDVRDGLPPVCALGADCVPEAVVVEVGVETDEVGEVVVYAREVLLEVAADAVELGNDAAQALREVGHLPQQRGVTLALQDGAVHLPVLQHLQQVAVEGVVDALHHLPQRAIRRLLLDGLRVGRSSQLSQKVAELIQSSALFLHQRLKIAIFEPLELVEAALRQPLIKVIAEGSLPHEDVNKGNFFKRFCQGILLNGSVNDGDHLPETISDGDLLFGGGGVIINGKANLLNHLLEPGQFVSAEAII
jgi:hypothetical protein